MEKKTTQKANNYKLVPSGTEVRNNSSPFVFLYSVFVLLISGFLAFYGLCSLHADISYFLCFIQKRDICVMALLIVFQYPVVFSGINVVLGFTISCKLYSCKMRTDAVWQTGMIHPKKKWLLERSRYFHCTLRPHKRHY